VTHVTVRVAVTPREPVKCPFCSRSWVLLGRKSVTGFVVASAVKHITRCFLSRFSAVEVCEVFIRRLP
jgi:hypothetical protein